MTEAHKISFVDALHRLPLPATPEWPEGVWDVEMMRRGTLSIAAFAPHGTDHQSPHKQDEFYLVVKGTAELCVADGPPLACSSGDVLFVPAGMFHRFEKISDDFATWVIFFGPG